MSSITNNSINENNQSLYQLNNNPNISQKKNEESCEHQADNQNAAQVIVQNNAATERENLINSVNQKVSDEAKININTIMNFKGDLPAMVLASPLFDAQTKLNNLLEEHKKNWMDAACQSYSSENSSKLKELYTKYLSEKIDLITDLKNQLQPKILLAKKNISLCCRRRLLVMLQPDLCVPPNPNDLFYTKIPSAEDISCFEKLKLNNDNSHLYENHDIYFFKKYNLEWNPVLKPAASIQNPIAPNEKCSNELDFENFCIKNLPLPPNANNYLFIEKTKDAPHLKDLGLFLQAWHGLSFGEYLKAVCFTEFYKESNVLLKNEYVFLSLLSIYRKRNQIKDKKIKDVINLFLNVWPEQYKNSLNELIQEKNKTAIAFKFENSLFEKRWKEAWESANLSSSYDHGTQLDLLRPILIKEGQYQLLRNDLDSSLEKNKDSYLLTFRGLVKEKMGNPEKAADDYIEALQLGYTAARLPLNMLISSKKIKKRPELNELLKNKKTNLENDNKIQSLINEFAKAPRMTATELLWIKEEEKYQKIIDKVLSPPTNLGSQLLKEYTQEVSEQHENLIQCMKGIFEGKDKTQAPDDAWNKVLDQTNNAVQGWIDKLKAEYQKKQEEEDKKTIGDKWERESETTIIKSQFQTTLSLSDPLQLQYIANKSVMLDSFLEQFQQLLEKEDKTKAPSTDWRMKKNTFINDAKQANVTLGAAYRAKQDEADRMKTLEEMRQLMGKYLNNKAELALRHLDCVQEDLDIKRKKVEELKIGFQSKIDIGDPESFAQIQASLDQEVASLIQSERARVQEEMNKLMKQLEEQKAENVRLQRELRKKEEQIEQQGLDFDLLDRETSNWREAVSKINKDAKGNEDLGLPLMEQIIGFLDSCNPNNEQLQHQLQQWIKQLKKISSPTPDKHEIIALLNSFGFKHSTTRGSHFYYVREGARREKIFCLIYQHGSELSKAEKKLCLERILKSLKDFDLPIR